MHHRVLILTIFAIWVGILVPSAHSGQPQRMDQVRNYTSAYFWTANAGILADPQDIVLTHDGGSTWTRVLSVYGPWQGLGNMGRPGIFNSQVWWLEDSGNLWRTSDQGRSWTSQRLPNIRGVVFVAPNDGWGVQVGGGALVRTQDGGRNWQPIRLPGIDTSRWQIQRLTFVSPDVGWAVLSVGNICRTTDGGRTWTRTGQAPGLVGQIVARDAQTGFALDLRAPKIYRTRDGGTTWDTVQLPPLPDKSSLEGLFALDPMTAWAVGTRGIILNTTDGGTTWRQQTSGVQAWLSAAHFADRQHGWAVGGLNTILKTTDGGETWTKVDDDLKNWRP